MGEPMSAARVERGVAAQYAATHERLRNDPEYVRLSVAAAAEEECTPERFLERNRLAFYVELHMPLA